MAKVLYSADIQELRGKSGNAVYSRSRSGPTRRNRVMPRQPRTTSQTTVRNTMGKANVAMHNLTNAQVSAWQNYAATLIHHDPVTGHAFTPVWNDVYTGLAMKFLQINPTGTIPTAIPAGAFGGDSISMTASGGTAQVTFVATGPNAASVKTEFLLQSLKSKLRTPNPDGYKSRGFIAIPAGGLSVNVSATAGWYAVGYRFVSTLTGQASQMITLGLVQVS